MGVPLAAELRPAGQVAHLVRILLQVEEALHGGEIEPHGELVALRHNRPPRRLVRAVVAGGRVGRVPDLALAADRLDSGSLMSLDGCREIPARARLLLRKPAERQQRRHEVNRSGECPGLRPGWNAAWQAHQQRHVQGLVFRLSLAVHAVRPCELTMIGGEDHKGAAGQTRLVQERHDPAHLMVQGLAEAVVSGKLLHRALPVRGRDVRPRHDLPGLVQVMGPRRPERSVGRPPRQVAGERSVAVPTHEVDREVCLEGWLIVRLRRRLFGDGQGFAGVAEAPGPVIDMAAIESLERLEAAPPPARRDKARLPRAVHVPLADVVGRVAR